MLFPVVVLLIRDGEATLWRCVPSEQVNWQVNENTQKNVKGASLS